MLALGHGLGLFGDVIAGILGAFLGGFLAALFHIKVEVFGYPIISKMVVAFAGSVILWRRPRRLRQQCSALDLDFKRR